MTCPHPRRLLFLPCSLSIAQWLSASTVECPIENVSAGPAPCDTPTCEINSSGSSRDAELSGQDEGSGARQRGVLAQRGHLEPQVRTDYGHGPPPDGCQRGFQERAVEQLLRS